jgi:hypothetical protein
MPAGRVANQLSRIPETELVYNPRATTTDTADGRDVSNQTNTGTETRWTV